jgi:hypothetical protein
MIQHISDQISLNLEKLLVYMQLNHFLPPLFLPEAFSFTISS